MTASDPNRLIVAVSSSALFDLEASHRVYEEEGLDAYAKFQIAREEEVLEPGPAFPVVKKLLAINQIVKADCVEVILLSRNSSDTGLRVFNSIEHYDLPIIRAAFTSGISPYQYANAFGAHLFLSTNATDVTDSISSGLAAARLLKTQTKESGSQQLRIAFDGDAVVFSDEAERIFQARGLAAFAESERVAARQPLAGGPFKGFLEALHRLQARFELPTSPIRTALVTARSAPAHERVIRTLRDWKIRIDESLFVGGLDKSAFLRAFDADIFFDDQIKNFKTDDSAGAAAHVPSGVVNAELQGEPNTDQAELAVD